MPYGNGVISEMYACENGVEKKVKEISQANRGSIFEFISENFANTHIDTSHNEVDDIHYVEELSEFDRLINSRIDKIYWDRKYFRNIEQDLESSYVRFTRSEYCEELLGPMREIIEDVEQIVRAFNNEEDFLNELHRMISKWNERVYLDDIPAYFI